MQAMRFWGILLVLCCVHFKADAAEHAATPKTDEGATPSTASGTNTQQVAETKISETKPQSSGPEDKLAKWKLAAERGEAWAQFNLGLAYHQGKDVPKNELESVRWYELAAQNGYAAAQANLGYCYEIGFGVAVEPAEAVKWYQLAAVQGNAFAQYNLAKKYQTGPGVALDPKSAEKWFRAAAQQNFVPAFFSLGQIYANEFTANTNYAEALKWFRFAAEQSYPPAQHAIGYLFATGKAGVTNNFEAVRWYQVAASHGFADSQYNLGLCYENGLGVPQNLIAAVNHYRTAAESGHPQAQYSLGVCYYEGKGVEIDFVQAYKWWNLAAVQGIPEAHSNREILARLMPDTQIREAQRLAGEFATKRKHGSLEVASLIQTASAEGTEVKRVGTGFIISTDGFLLTNLRLISGATNISVVTESGSFTATPYRADPLNDLAVLKIDGAFRPLALTTSRDATVDSSVVVVGFDGPNQGQFNPKVARGKVTSLLGFQADPRQLSIEPHVPTSYAGSAVMNARGQVVAVTLTDYTQNLAGEAKPKVTSSFALKSDHLIGFLRPMQEVKWVADDSKIELSPDEVVSRARTGTVLVLVL